MRTTSLFFAMLTALFATTPPSVYAQSPSPSQSQSSGPNGVVSWLSAIITFSIIGVILVVGTVGMWWADHAAEKAAKQRARDEDVELQSVSSSYQERNQEASPPTPALPVLAHTKENEGIALNQSGSNSGPPPYYSMEDAHLHSPFQPPPGPPPSASQGASPRPGLFSSEVQKGEDS